MTEKHRMHIPNTAQDRQALLDELLQIIWERDGPPLIGLPGWDLRPMLEESGDGGRVRLFRSGEFYMGWRVRGGAWEKVAQRLAGRYPKGFNPIDLHPEYKAGFDAARGVLRSSADSRGTYDAENDPACVTSNPPCFKAVILTCGHVHARGQDPDQVNQCLCSRPSGHPGACMGCIYCFNERMIAVMEWYDKRSGSRR